MLKKGGINVVRVPCKLDLSFFKMWFIFLQPFHHLTEREMEVAAFLVKNYYDLSKVVSDPDLLDRVSVSEDVKKKVREECNISLAHLQVIMSKLRKSNIIVNNRLNPKFIPRLAENSSDFKLLLLFDFK